MNQFSARKLGEVLAFAKVGQMILSKGKSALVKVFGKVSVEALQQLNTEHLENITKFAEQNQVLTVVEQKSQKTSGKLLEMQELYLQDQWEDESELLEWLGFFEGAALVHWKLVEGVANKSEDLNLGKIVNKGLEMHQGFLFKISEAIRKVGLTKAAAI